MRLTVLLVFILMNLMTCLEVKGQNIDTLSQEKVLYQDSSNTEADAFEGTDDFSPGLLFFALLGLGLVLACIGAGIAVTVIALLILFGLIALGVLSTSVIIGLYNRSFAKGFKSFIVLFASSGGLVVCAAGLGIVSAIGNWWTSLLNGILQIPPTFFMFRKL